MATVLDVTEIFFENRPVVVYRVNESDLGSKTHRAFDMPLV